MYVSLGHCEEHADRPEIISIVMIRHVNLFYQVISRFVYNKSYSSDNYTVYPMIYSTSFLVIVGNTTYPMHCPRYTQIIINHQHINERFSGSLGHVAMLLDNISMRHVANTKEIAGTVLVCMLVESLEEAIKLNKQNSYGNNRAIFTSSVLSSRKLQHEIDVGRVGVNFPILYLLQCFSRDPMY